MIEYVLHRLPDTEIYLFIFNVVVVYGVNLDFENSTQNMFFYLGVALICNNNSATIGGYLIFQRRSVISRKKLNQ